MDQIKHYKKDISITYNKYDLNIKKIIIIKYNISDINKTQSNKHIHYKHIINDKYDINT